MKKKNKTLSEELQNQIKKSSKLIPLTHIYIHECSLSWLSTDTSIDSGGVKLAIWAQTSTVSKIMWS